MGRYVVDTRGAFNGMGAVAPRWATNGLGLITQGVLQNDDVTTMAAAMTQAAATGRNVSVTLAEDGSTFTATPHDLDASPPVAAPVTASGPSVSRTIAAAVTPAVVAAQAVAKQAVAPSGVPTIAVVLGLAALGYLLLNPRKGRA